MPIHFAVAVGLEEVVQTPSSRSVLLAWSCCVVLAVVVDGRDGKTSKNEGSEIRSIQCEIGEDARKRCSPSSHWQKQEVFIRGEDGNENVYGLSFQLVLVRFTAYAMNPVIKDAEYKEGIAHHWNSVHYVDYFP